MYPLRLKALTELAGLAGLGALQCRSPGLQAEARQSETRNKAKMFHSEGDQALERAPREAVEPSSIGVFKSSLAALALAKPRLAGLAQGQLGVVLWPAGGQPGRSDGPFCPQTLGIDEHSSVV